MNQKTALVVDDSKTHLFVLKRMLELHGLTVETADSAEAGLEHLSAKLPDIIFMDHMMPGMDGLQAVSIIKDDPRTAMIPIVMYTSREGEVYVGQARALGAVDVLPKEVEAGEILDVLKRLNLVSVFEGASASTNQDKQKSKIVESGSFVQGLSDKEIRQLAEAVANAVPTPDLGEGFAQLLSKQRRDVKHDIRELVQSANKILVDKISAQQKLLDETSEHNFDQTESQPKPSWFGFKLSLAFIAGIGFYALFNGLVSNNNLGSSTASENVRQQVQALQDENNELEAKILDSGSGITTANLHLVSTIEWLTNRSLSYPFDEIALDDQRAILIQELFDRLSRAGFKGQVNLEVHVGDFCLVRDKQGLLGLPDSNHALAKCDQINQPNDEAIRQGARQTLAFVHFVETHSALERGDIRLVIKSIGNAQPVKPYLPKEMVKTAGEWNRIATQNNQLVIRISQ